MTAAKTYGISGTLTETYNYDALGNRIAKTTDGVKTEYVIDYSTGYAQVLRATTDADTIFYTRGFELISRKDATRELWYLSDGGGNVRYLTDSTGSVTDSLVFDAFGNTVSRAGETGDSYGFQGEQQDATGLYYLRARYMNPATGSFTQMDTYGGSLSDPMSLHKYLFANANPVKYRDPSGHAATMVDTLAALSMSMILTSCVSMAIYSVGCVYQHATGKQQFTLDQFICGLGKAGIKGLYIGAMSYMAASILAVCITSLLGGLLVAAILSLLGRFSYDLAQYFYNNGNYYAAAAMQVLGDALNIFALNALFAGLGTLGNSSNQAASGAGEGAGNTSTKILFRGDRPSVKPEDVFENGFIPKGTHDDALLHTSSNTTSGNFISTSSDIEIANGFVQNNGYIYELESSNYIDMNAAYGEAAYYPEQLEFSIPGGVSGSQIKGAWVVKNGVMTGEFIPNPGFIGD